MGRRPAQRPSRRKCSTGVRKLLVIDTTNTFELIKARGTEDSVTCRDLDGYFSRVWSVHPVATLTTSDQWTPRFGPPVEYRLNARHIFVEGKIGRFLALRRFFVLNFLIGQITMFVWLYRLIRRERISVIRAGDPLYTGLLSWALARLNGIPFVVRVGGNHDKGYRTTGQPVMPRLFRERRYEKMAERFVFRRADLVAGANQDNLNFALANGARPERTAIFRYGNLIAKHHFDAPERRPLERDDLDSLDVEEGRFLLYIGRLEPVKHPDDVVRVLAEIRRRGHDIKAVLAGEGGMRRAVDALAVELGVSDSLVCPGSLDQQRLARLLPRVAAVVSPHTGRALAEAALAAAPIAAYDIDWQGELIRSGVTGALVAHGNWLGLADAVEHFLRDPEDARRIGQAARGAALEMLDPQSLNENERRHYSALLDPG